MRDRLLVLLEWCSVAVFSCLLAIHTLPRAWNTLNTDFPNYYLVAQMVDEHVDTERAYEWRWLQRQKDHKGIDQRVVGLVPITPFSTLFIVPLTHWKALPAKRLWLVAQLLLLLPIAFALRSISGQPLRRIALFITACLPLHRNLVFGQYYILLLALLVFACRAYLCKRHAMAGVLIAVAAATKIFPILFVLYFLRRRDWKALFATLLTLGLIAGLSVWIFGWNMHRTYLDSVLPWTLRGEALPPYMLASSSLSTLLHCLFVYEPQWNPRPWLDRPWLFATLQPLLQTMILAPAILVISPLSSGRRIALEWSAFVTATLAISTVPASYNFTLMIFPAIVLCAWLLPRHPWKAAGVAVLFLAIGYPGWNTAPANGLRVLLHVPRLYWLLLLTLGTYWSLGLRGIFARSTRWPALLWAFGFAVVTAVGMRAGLHHVHGLYDDYAYRLAVPDGALMASDPAVVTGYPGSIVLRPEGYRFESVSHSASFAKDQLSFTAGGEQLWVEDAAQTSTLHNLNSSTDLSIAEAGYPVLSPDRTHIAYLRQSYGHGQLFEASVLPTPPSPESVITPGWLDVEEAALLRDGSVIVSGLTAHHPSHLYRVQDQQATQLAEAGEARFPAASPDGRWLAYSRFTNGNWNLWLMNLQTNTFRQISRVPCNQVESSWEDDSKTLLYASDCGRALWFTAICRRRVMP